MNIVVFEDKHPDKDISEDLVHVEGSYILVMDGATPQSNKEAHYETIAFVNEIKENIFSIIKNKCDISLEDIIKESYTNTSKYKYRPSATMCLCKVDKCACEYILVGDVFIYYESDGRSECISDRRLKNVAVREREILHNTTDPILKSKVRDDLINVEKSYRNKENGYWILDSEMKVDDVVKHMLFGTINNYNNLMIATDGILKALKCGLVNNMTELNKRLQEDKYDFIKALRGNEIEHDDISTVLISNKVI